jgi:biopolymer transport protein ExbD
MAGRSNDNDSAISEINVVPLVDIILVVLIIFMVTAPMIMKPSINVNLPKTASGDKTTPTQLSITMTADGKVLLNGSVADDATISAQAKDQFTKNPEIQAIISADKDVPHGRVMSIIDIIKLAGVKKFAFSIDRKTPQ